jgi:hypothetical protein
LLRLAGLARSVSRLIGIGMAALCAYIQAAILVWRHAEQKRLIEKMPAFKQQTGDGLPV